MEKVVVGAKEGFVVTFSFTDKITEVIHKKELYLVSPTEKLENDFYVKTN